MKRFVRSSAVLVLAWAAFAVACSKKPAPRPLPNRRRRKPRRPRRRTPWTRRRSTADAGCSVGDLRALTKLSGYLNPVFFDLDRADIRPTPRTSSVRTPSSSGSTRR